MNTNKFYHYKNFVIALLFMVFYKVGAQPVPPQGYVWESVSELSDEFDVWDASKWHKPLWNYGLPVQMRAENSGVNNGKLWIKATLDNTAQRWFETSRVMSNAQIDYPMYTESRIRTAHISAYNTFWLNNGDSNDRNEIDVIENNSKPSCGCQPDFPWQMNSQYFHVVNGDTKRAHGNFDNRNLSINNPKRGVKWNEEYHTVGVWWKDERNIQFYLDGEPAGNVVSERDFTRRLNIIWDLWTGNYDWLGGIAIKSDLNNNNINTMYVDWVHTYKLKEDDSNLPDKIALSNPNLDIESMMSYQFDVNYSTTNNNREILVSFWKGTTWLGAGVVDVNPGQNQTQQVTVNLNNLPVPGNDYVYKYHIRPRGTDYNQATDQGEVANIVVRETLSVDDSNLKEFKMYPSPVRDLLHITQLESETSVSIFDYTGRQLMQKTSTNGVTTINVSSFQSGAYFVKIKGYKIKRLIIK